MENILVVCVIVALAVAVFEFLHNANFKAKILAQADVAKADVEEFAIDIKEKFDTLLAQIKKKA